MLKRRVIPCLDVCNGRIVKGVRFANLRDAGDPVTAAVEYERQGADEIVMLDVSATPEGRATHSHTVKLLREALSIPLCVGGGVRNVHDASRLLEAGADKVAINTAAVEQPNLIREIANRFGVQCTVVAIDAARHSAATWHVVTHSGSTRCQHDAVRWASQAAQHGAGEILLTSWDRDGTRSGYDLALVSAVSQAVNVPVIASGGASSVEHMLEALRAGADAVLAASIFHEASSTVRDIKLQLNSAGLEVRL